MRLMSIKLVSQLLVLSLFCLSLGHVFIPSVAHAQDTADETYDPFADYSEFEEAAQEEADINFFRNGRFVTMGLVGGMQSFTGGLAKDNQSAPFFGIFLSYFFDLRFALQFGYAMSDHNMSMAGPPVQKGTTAMQKTSFDFKYYFNTQNVTRGLAALNPYALIGFSNNARTRTYAGLDGFVRDGGMGIDFGAGLEIPMMRNKMFFGIQALYQYVNFKGEGSPEKIVDTTTYNTAGDVLEIIGILGVNF